MLICQLELTLHSSDLFSKYLKILKVAKPTSTLKGKGAFFDPQKKIIEVNTCGFGQHIVVSFLFDKKQVSLANLANLSSEVQSSQPSAMTSEKLKNEILPLLNGSDDDIDELDDEVAMISHKRDGKGRRVKKDPVKIEDIKIQVKEEKPIPSKNEEKKDGDPEATRNFNTLPRNYSDSVQKNA
mmetsp:Transcript_30590/g.30044  ORF Transcript_30590/g.30044 Transcript_30590/m.30044 type:complete len:183 (-) Transcript_30590:564-1112(-)